MNQEEISNYLSAGLSIGDVANLMLAEKSLAQPIAQPIAQPTAQPAAQPIAQPTAQPAAQPIAQPAAQPIAQPADFSQLLSNIGASLQSPMQAPAQQVVTPASTPSNTGITPEEATKLFQAWSMGQATQSIELPPNANDVLAQRFASMYGVDTDKKRIGGN